MRRFPYTTGKQPSFRWSSPAMECQEAWSPSERSRGEWLPVGVRRYDALVQRRSAALSGPSGGGT